MGTKSSSEIESSESHKSSRAIRAEYRVSLRIQFGQFDWTTNGKLAYQSGAFTVDSTNSRSMVDVRRLTAVRGASSLLDKNCSRNASIVIGAPNLDSADNNETAALCEA